MPTIHTPFYIAGLRLKNRIGQAPINSGLFESNGNFSSYGYRYYKSCIESGIGLFTVGGIAVSPEGRSNANSLLLNSDEKALGISKIVDLGRANDVRIAGQIMHSGRQASVQDGDHPIYAESPQACEVIQEKPIQLTKNKIAEVIKNFSTSSIVLEKAGIDFVEIHAAHGYLISGFLSPFTNNRKDEYGGDLFNRFRILYQILEEVKLITNIPIGIRINCIEYIDDKITFHEKIKGLAQIKKYFDYISISAGKYSINNDIIIPSRTLPKALWEKYSSIFKSELKKPTMVAGNIDTLDLAENIIKNNSADIALIGRSLLSDPYLIKKHLAQNKCSIIECDGCNLCKYNSRGFKSVFCPNNPFLKMIKKNETRN